MSEQSQQGGWTPSRSAAGHRNPWLVAVVVSIATFMVVLDTAIANVSLRYIAGSRVLVLRLADDTREEDEADSYQLWTDARPELRAFTQRVAPTG